MKNYYLGFFISLFLIACTTSKTSEKDALGIVQKPEVTKTDSLSFFLGHYDKFFTTNFNVSECPGAAVVIVKDSTVIYKKGFGVREIHTQDSVDVNSVFRIASLSKGMTAVLAGNLVDNGELQWDQHVKEVLPEFDLKDREQANRLKINHILSHTTGLYKYTYSRLIKRGLSVDQLIRNFRQKGVVTTEGVEYEYQNAMFSVIERIMERKASKPFATLLQERVFVPSGMKQASSSFSAITSTDNVALPHTYNHYSKKYNLTNLSKSYYNVAAAGGINASISDMGEYLKVLLGHRPHVISKERLQDIFNPIICTNEKDTYVNLWDGVTDSYYAMGWRVLDYRERRIIYHGGNVNQYKTQLLIDPDRGIAICALFNAPNPFNGPVMPTFLNYYDFYLDTIDRNKKADQNL